MFNCFPSAAALLSCDALAPSQITTSDNVCFSKLALTHYDWPISHPARRVDERRQFNNPIGLVARARSGSARIPWCSSTRTGGPSIAPLPPAKTLGPPARIPFQRSHPTAIEPASQPGCLGSDACAQAVPPTRTITITSAASTPKSAPRLGSSAGIRLAKARHSCLLQPWSAGRAWPLPALPIGRASRALGNHMEPSGRIKPRNGPLSGAAGRLLQRAWWRAREARAVASRSRRLVAIRPKPTPVEGSQSDSAGRSAQRSGLGSADAARPSEVYH